MKILIIPDVHGSPKWTETTKSWANYDHVIFLGDYADSLKFKRYKTWLNAKNIIDTSADYENVTLLVGNHDAHYYMYMSARGEGYENRIYDRYNLIYSENQSRLKIAKLITCGDYTLVFTHAGIKTSWVDMVYAKFEEEFGPGVFEPTDIHSVVDFINNDIANTRLAYMVHAVGEIRRGFAPAAGPLWAHITELKEDPYPNIIQVVGHTPLDTFQVHTVDDHTQCLFCDMDMGDKPFMHLEINDAGLSYYAVNSDEINLMF